MKIAAILLAAGESTRMGRPKPLLPWFGATLVERQIEALRAAGVCDVFVVTGHRAYEIHEYIRGPGVHRVVNPHYRQGKSTSVKAGLAALPRDADTIVVLAVDQPRPAALIRKVIESHVERGALISYPRYRNRGGHPLVFDASLSPELDAISEETQGLRQVVREHARDTNCIDVDTPIARFDINTPEAYEKAAREFPDPRADPQE